MNETFEKCSILFKAKTILQDSGIGSAEGGPAAVKGHGCPESKAKILTAGIH